MSERPTQGQGAEAAARVIYTGDEPNPILHFFQRPRIMLILLAIWSILSVLTEMFISSGLFLENHAAGDIALDGAMGGFALSWQGVPLAAVYIYALRDPMRHKPVFILALIHMASTCVSQIYQWAIDTYSLESIAIPLFGSAVLGALVFLHIFSSRSDEEVAEKAR